MIYFLLIYFVGVSLCGVMVASYAIMYAKKKNIPVKMVYQISHEETCRYALGYSCFNCGIILRILYFVCIIVLFPLELFKWSYNLIKETDKYINKTAS